MEVNLNYIENNFNLIINNIKIEKRKNSIFIENKDESLLYNYGTLIAFIYNNKIYCLDVLTRDDKININYFYNHPKNLNLIKTNDLKKYKKNLILINKIEENKEFKEIEKKRKI